MKKLYILIGVIVILLIILFVSNKKTEFVVTSFEECVKAGNPVMETYPRQCKAGDKNFVEIIKTEDTGILPFDSGVEGVVTIGPTCPVVREGDPSCDDKPYITSVQVTRVGSPKNQTLAVMKTDNNGKYKIMLPAGEYTLQTVSESVMPRCEIKNITILPSKIIKADLSCDSGIR